MYHLAAAWNMFLSLPEAHASDRDEFMRAIHAAQNILLAREALKDDMSALISRDDVEIK